MYTAYFKKYFERKLKKLTKRNPILQKRVRSEVDDLQNDPYHNSKELTERFSGKREVYIGRSGHRLFYSICEECRSKGYQRFNPCSDCDEKEDKSIIFWDLQPKSALS